MFDFIEKLTELSIAGNSLAENFIKEFEAAQANGDYEASQKFENRVLKRAEADFELISPIERVDLERLKEDRNRCIHPSIKSSAEIYSPTAELARYHLKNIYQILLSKPPAQGKYAAQKLQELVEAEYLPFEYDKFLALFSSSPLRNARDGLVRQFVRYCLKSILLDNKDGDDYARAIRASLDLHPAIGPPILYEALESAFKVNGEGCIDGFFYLLELVPGVWAHTPENAKIIIESYLKSAHLDEDGLIHLWTASECMDLEKVALESASKLSNELLTKCCFDTDGKFPIEVALKRYIESSSFEEANYLAKGAMSYVYDKLSSEQCRKLLSAVATNTDLSGSFALGNLLHAIFEERGDGHALLEWWYKEDEETASEVYPRK